MMYSTPDLSGIDTNFAATGIVRAFVETGGKIPFDVPIFATTLKIVPFNNTTTQLVEGVDYTIEDDDYDTAALSRAVAMDLSFDKKIIKSVTVASPAIAMPFKVICSYQCLFSNTTLSPDVADQGITVLSPSSFSALLSDVTYIRGAITQIGNNSSDTTDVPTLLEIDPNCENSDNVITGEVHKVDTFNNKRIIRPVNGSFFVNSELALYDASGNLLKIGVDYSPAISNFEKIATSTSAYDICEIIELITDRAEAVSLTYHGYGGAPTIDDMKILLSNIKGIQDFLASNTFLTEYGLTGSQTIQFINKRVAALESNMRILTNDPQYGDATAGTAAARALRSSDTYFHWWNVATLFKSANSSTVYTKGSGLYHIELSNLGFSCDLAVAVNLDATRNPVSIDAHNVNFDPGFDTVSDSLSNVLPPVIKARVVWNTLNGSVSGAILQIGLTLPNLSEVMGIQDIGTSESPWIMLTGATADDANPKDTGITLPDGLSVWSDPLTTQQSSTTTGTSSEAIQTLQVPTGYLAYNGNSVVFSQFDETVSAPMQITTTLPYYYTVTDATFLRFVISGSDSLDFDIEVPVKPNADGTARGRSVVPVSLSGDYGVLSVILTPGDASTRSKPTLTVKLYGTASVSDALTVRYITAHS